MKILHVITGLNVGGAETMLARLLETRQQAPDIVPEVASLMTPGFVGGRIAATGVVMHDLGMKGIASSIPALFRLAALISRSRPDAIMAWMHHGQIATLAAVALAGTRTPVVWNIRHSLSGFDREKPATRLILRLLARFSGRAAAVVYNSHTGAREYRAFGFEETRQHIIPNGFDPNIRPAEGNSHGTAREIFGISPKPLLIGMVARAHPMKDVPNLVAAFRRTLDAGVDAHLLLVGEDMDRPTPALADLLSDIPRHRWTLSGQRSDVATWLGTLDILALPSAWGEGFPNIVGEALLSGVPCVGTDVGDTGLLIGEAGATVPPRDPEALANALIELARIGPAARRRMGMNGQARVREAYSIDHVFGRYAALCRRIAGTTMPSATPVAGQRMRDAA